MISISSRMDNIGILAKMSPKQRHVLLITVKLYLQSRLTNPTLYQDILKGMG